MNVRIDGMDAIDITALRQAIIRHHDAIMGWVGLDDCPRTCPLKGARLCTYANWSARAVDKHACS